jgi:hypothetical protein
MDTKVPERFSLIPAFHRTRITVRDTTLTQQLVAVMQAKN